jgi:hypothetical protein
VPRASEEQKRCEQAQQAQGPQRAAAPESDISRQVRAVCSRRPLRKCGAGENTRLRAYAGAYAGRWKTARTRSALSEGDVGLLACSPASAATSRPRPPQPSPASPRLPLIARQSACLERERERDGHQGSRGGPEATHGRPRRVGPVRPSQLGSRTRQRLQLTTPCTPPLLPGDPGSASLLQNTATPDRPPGCLRLGGDGQGQRSAYGLLPSSSRRSSPPWADLAHLLAFARPPTGQARSMDPLNLDKLLTAMSPSAQGACGSCGRRRHRCARLTRSPVDSVPADIRTEVEGLIREYLERNIE